MRAGFEMTDERLAYVLLRAVAGINLLMHGVSRLRMGSQFAEKMTAQFANSPLPAWGVHGFAVVLPAVEALLGLLLLLGWKTRAALVGASLLMMVLTFGTALIQDWATTGIQLMYALVFSVLLFMRRHNGWGMDGCWKP